MGQLAEWDCHKTVKAGKILRLPVLLGDDKGQSRGVYEVTVEDVNGAPAKVECGPEVFARAWPSVGDYLVIYQPDRYISWSPAKTFEEGYTRRAQAA